MTIKYWERGNAEISYCPPELHNYDHHNFDTFVVDDFLDNPAEVRTQIMNLGFQAPPNPKKGVISFNALIPDNILLELGHKVEQILNKSIQFHPRSKCAMTYEHVPKHRICHVDGGDNMEMFNWTVVVYLNLPEQCQGGTNLYEHLPTGDIYNKRGVMFYEDDFRQKQKWQLIEQVEMKFNRALFCPAWRFHALANTFGQDKDSARITLNPKVIAF